MRKESLLKYLNLIDFEFFHPEFENEYKEVLDLFIADFLEEASLIFDDKEKKAEIQLLINKSLMKDVLNITQKTAVLFILVVGMSALAIRATENPRLFENNSTTPFASMSMNQIRQRSVPQQLSSNQASVFSNKSQTNKTSERVALPSNRAVVAQKNVLSSSAKSRIRLEEVHRRGAIQLDKLQSKNTISDLLDTNVQSTASFSRIRISPQEAFHRSAKILSQKINDYARTLRSNNRIIVPQITFGCDLAGNLTGEVFLLNSVGMQDANQALRKEVPKIIAAEELNLTYINKRQEGDHFKPATQRDAYKLQLSNIVDSSASVIKHPELHKTITSYAKTATYSRLMPDGEIRPGLSYVDGVTPTRLIENEHGCAKRNNQALRACMPLIWLLCKNLVKHDILRIRESF